MDIKAALDRLAELRAERIVIAEPFDNQIMGLEMERDIATAAIVGKEASLEENIQAAVAEQQKTVKGDALQAVYTKGRVKWNARGLAGYAVAHPEIETFRSVGKPSVSIRKIRR